MEIQDILSLIQAVDDHGLTELKLDDGAVKLSLKKEETAVQAVNLAGAGYPVMPVQMAGGALMGGQMTDMQIPGGQMPGMQVSAGQLSGMQVPGGQMPGMQATGGQILGMQAAGGQFPQTDAQAQSAALESDHVMTSPLVGTFYNASSPDAEPFVKVGDAVKKGQVLGIIEAMKLMNEIECEFDGVLEAVLVNNEEVVEYGQPLFRIR